jgi:hypothetical protein
MADPGAGFAIHHMRWHLMRMPRKLQRGFSIGLLMDSVAGATDAGLLILRFQTTGMYVCDPGAGDQREPGRRRIGAVVGH